MGKKIYFAGGIFAIIAFSVLFFFAMKEGKAQKDRVQEMRLEIVAPIQTYKPTTSSTNAFRPNEKSELIVLCLHHVGTSGMFSVGVEQFGDIIMDFSKEGYTFVDAEDLRHYNETFEKVPKKMVMFSFDDGYEDNYSIAAPILEDYGVKGTFFIPTDRIGKNGYMTRDQIKSLSNRGFVIGSHTVSHPDLKDLDLSAIKKEFALSKDTLEGIIEKPVNSIAYPGGSVTKAIADLAAQYYAIGFLASHHDGYIEDSLTIQRYGVFSYNYTKQSILENEQADDAPIN